MKNNEYSKTVEQFVSRWFNKKFQHKELFEKAMREDLEHLMHINFKIL